MTRKFMQDEVFEMFRAVGFEPDEGAVYVNCIEPISGVWVECDHLGAPRLHNVRRHGSRCNACGKIRSAKISADLAFDKALNAAGVDGYTLFDRFTKEYVRPNRGLEQTGWTHYVCAKGHTGSMALRLFLNGRRCPLCSESGYKTNKPGTLYLLARTVDGVEERQYGITNDMKRRMSEHKRHGWTLVDQQSNKNGAVPKRRESRIKQAMKLSGVYPFQYSGEKFDGFTEAWTEHMLEPFDSLPELNSWAIATVASHKETRW